MCIHRNIAFFLFCINIAIWSYMDVQGYFLNAICAGILGAQYYWTIERHKHVL